MTDRKDEPRIRAFAKRNRRYAMPWRLFDHAAEQREQFEARRQGARRALIDTFRAQRAAWAWSAPTLAQAGRRIISAHLEQAGEVLADDPLTAPAPVKRKANTAAMRDALTAFLAGRPEARKLAEWAMAA